MQAQHHRGEERVVERAVLIVRRQRAERQSTRPARHRRALVRRLDLHVAAEERALDQVVRAARVRQLGRQLGVNRGTMQTFIVILQDQLPVRLHVVLNAPDCLQQGQVVARESSLERREPLRRRSRLGIEVHEQEPFPRGERDGVQRIRLLIEAFHLVHVRRANQAPVERVGPRVIWALDRLGEAALGRFAQPRAAMATDVVVRVTLTGLIAQHDDALATDRRDEVIARRREGLIAADADPVAPEDPLRFAGEYFWIVVVAAGQRAGALAITLDGLQKAHRISRAALRPAAPGMPPPGCVPEPHRYSPSIGVR